MARVEITRRIMIDGESVEDVKTAMVEMRKKGFRADGKIMRDNFSPDKYQFWVAMKTKKELLKL